MPKFEVTYFWTSLLSQYLTLDVQACPLPPHPLPNLNVGANKAFAFFLFCGLLGPNTEIGGGWGMSEASPFI